MPVRKMSEFEHKDTVDDRPSYILHPLRGVVWAAFWGTPVAAGIIMAINYGRIGRKSAARNVAVLGVIATVILCAIIVLIPDDVLDSIPNAVFYVPQLVFVYMFAKSVQNDLIEKHIANGGSLASAWPSVGIGVICLPVVLGALFGVAYLLEPSYGIVVEFGNDEIYYAGEATEDDACKLAHVLKQVEFFGSTGASVRLHASSGQYTVSFALFEDAWRDTQTVEVFRDIGKTVAASGFPTPLEVHLCDDYFSAEETIRIE